MHRLEMPDGGGVLLFCQAKNRRNTFCIAGIFNAAGRQQAPPGGVQRLCMQNPKGVRDLRETEAFRKG